MAEWGFKPTCIHLPPKATRFPLHGGQKAGRAKAFTSLKITAVLTWSLEGFRCLNNCTANNNPSAAERPTPRGPAGQQEGQSPP